MRIGELAKTAGCDIETIRYYEKSGVLDAPRRSANGYREYAGQHLEQLQFIRHCRSLQIGLPDIRVLLKLQHQPAAGCKRVNDILDGHIAKVREQMKTLRMLERQLATLRQQCRAPRAIHECGILHNLNEAAEGHGCACHDQRGPAPAVHGSDG